MKKIIALALCFLSAFATAQNFEDSWKGFFSYVSVKDISQGNGKVYVAAENSVFAYDLLSQQIETISTINGLSGEVISSIYYSEDFGVLLVGYENGLMDVIVDGDEDILNVVDIFDKPTIPPDRKRINDFYEYDGRVYISAQFGITVYDLARLEFGDTYFIGDLGTQIEITQTTVADPYIYASSSEGGVRRALVDDEDLIDFARWTTLTAGNIRGVQTLGTEVFIARNNNIIQRYDEGVGFVQVENLGTPILDFETEGDILAITTEESIRGYGIGYSLVAVVNNTLPGFDFQLQSGMGFNNTFFLGTTNNGLLIVPFGSQDVLQALPDGPILNKPFSIDTSPGQLWVTFGDLTATSNPFPLSRFGISNLREETWTNIPYETLNTGLGGSVREPTDLVNVTINPNNPNDVYMSSFIGGLLHITDQTPDDFLDQVSSNLLEATVDGDNAGIRLYGTTYDRQGNLWVLQSKLDEGLLKLNNGTGDQFERVDLSGIMDNVSEQALIDVEISREGFVFFGSAENGLIGYNPTNGSLNRIVDGPGSGNLPLPNARAIAFDRQNRLWIGTSRGLRVLFNVGGFFDEEANTDAQEIIIVENGVPQELLFQQTITDIEVDGSNNKWISTATSGVFYLSSNGQETLLRFTKSNSPLPSDNVQDIAIDGSTGRVYFATVNGLVAFEGTSTAPRENLENVYAFPNPVRPGFNGNVTIDGLTAQANVKITDIEGNLVFETTSEGGSVLWDTTAFGQYRVASGVYLVMITTEDALETKVSKIMIVR
ncbi:two-component regulator propeller domain-containing protein [Aureisphaera galaxeae]|nr:two-component regulator propeller domain-containing protein [Aureisphaera galaxeae]